MKLPQIGVMIAAVFAPICMEASFDIDRFLLAISEVETGHNDRAVNPSSQASSRYQITRTVWRQWEPNTPFSKCRGSLARNVAGRHVEWLKSQLGPDPVALAAAWRWGLTGSRRGGWQSDYPVRVANLYYSPGFDHTAQL